MTLILTVQLPLAGMVAPDRETELAVELTVPDVQLVEAFGIAAVFTLTG